MKRCPECRRDYYDDSLIYCLDDGTALLEGPVSEEEPRTALLADLSTETPTKEFVEPASRNDARKISSRTSVIAGILGIILVTALGVGGYFYFGRGSVKQIDSIAVMPFVNESGNPDVEYLSDGMTESLINSLSTLPNLSVKARNTVFRYKGKEIDEKKVGQELSVQAVLFGRFIQRGDDLTLFLSLVESRTGNALWGEQYDRKMQDLSALRNDIVRDVAQKLRTRLSNADTTNLTKDYTANAEALRLYFHGRYFWEKRNQESIRRSIEYFNQAIEKDPNFARAYSGLADAYIVPANGIAPRDAMPKAKAAVTRALEIDNTLAEAHTSLARILQVYDWNWAEAEREYKRAIDLDPRYPLAHQWYGGYLERTGRLNESIAERKVAVELDPLSPSTSFELGLAYFFARDYDRGIDQFQKALELEKGFPSALQMLLVSYAQKGQFDLAIAKIQEIQESNIPATAGQVYAIAGRKDDAMRMIEELERRGREGYISATTFAFIYTPLGEKDKAIASLEKGYEERAFQMQFLKVDPRWDKLRDDPRFTDLMRRVGLSE
ncbi:MAG TPA: tetratricopeptide repeat protein [Pyrinomonadaceae bacterium]